MKKGDVVRIKKGSLSYMSNLVFADYITNMNLTIREIDNKKVMLSADGRLAAIADINDIYAIDND